MSKRVYIGEFNWRDPDAAIRVDEHDLENRTLRPVAVLARDQMVYYLAHGLYPANSIGDMCFWNSSLWVSGYDAIARINPDTTDLMAIFYSSICQGISRLEPTDGGIKAYSNKTGDIFYVNVLGEFYRLGPIKDLPLNEKETARQNFSAKTVAPGKIAIPHPVDYPELY